VGAFQRMKEYLDLVRLVLEQGTQKPIDGLRFEDFALLDYHPHPKIKFTVAG
jgi:thymidylate synthase